jgi:hypothetical protein
MENESERIQVDPRNIHYTKRNVPPPPVHINNVQLPQQDGQVSWATPWQETYLAQTHFRHPHKNVLVTRMQVRTLHKQQTSQTGLDLRNTTIQLGGPPPTSAGCTYCLTTADRVRVRVRVTLQLTVSQSVCLGVKPKYYSWQLHTLAWSNSHRGQHSMERDLLTG